MMKHFCDVLFNCLTTYSLDNTWIIVIIVLAVLLFSTLIAILIFSTRKIKKLKNNVKQLTNYPVKPLYVDDKKEEIEEEEKENISQIQEEVKQPIEEEKTIVKDKIPRKTKVIEETSQTIITEDKKEEPTNIEEEKTTVKERKPRKSKVIEPVKQVEEPVQEVVLEKEKNSPSRVLLGKYEVFHANDLYLYRLKASNGEIMVVSEVYTTEKGAIAAIDTIKKYVETGTIQIYQEKHGLFQFKLFATNKRLLAVSANYSTQAKCEAAANSFKKFAPISPVVVLEEDPEHLLEEIHLEASSDKKGGKIAVYEVDNGYEFRLLASNGVLLCSSNEYKTKKALTSAISIFKTAIKTGRFFIVKDKNDSYQFKLYNQDKRCIVIGEAYKNKNQAISAAKSVISFVNLAEIIEKNEEELLEVK